MTRKKSQSQVFADQDKDLFSTVPAKDYLGKKVDFKIDDYGAAEKWIPVKPGDQLTGIFDGVKVVDVPGHDPFEFVYINDGGCIWTVGGYYLTEAMKKYPTGILVSLIYKGEVDTGGQSPMKNYQIAFDSSDQDKVSKFQQALEPVKAPHDTDGLEKIEPESDPDKPDSDLPF